MWAKSMEKCFDPYSKSSKSRSVAMNSVLGAGNRELILSFLVSCTGLGTNPNPDVEGVGVDSFSGKHVHIFTAVALLML